MALPSVEAFLELIRKSEVAEPARLAAYLERLRAGGEDTNDPNKLSELMVRDGILTQFQAEHLRAGKWRGFFVGKYKILERLGSGGMGTVYLAEHKHMRRRVAIKVLPKSKASDSSSLERFYREAKAIAALDHPNIVRAYDIDHDPKENVHFLVMEYVDGASLQEIIKAHGPMAIERATNYLAQSALALQHAHEIGLVHRDIKPGNILIDRTGLVKVLDMGLARFFNDNEDILTRKYDENVLGTADYLAPEQALDSHTVDIRADIYGLGCTFYFVLTGKSPFGEGTVAQKLIWHQTRKPKPLKENRAEVPDEVVSILERMMAKSTNDRYQIPGEVVEALAPYTQEPIPPPPLEEMPNLCLAATGGTPGEAVAGGSSVVSSSAPTALRKASSAVMRADPKAPGSGSSIRRANDGGTRPAGGSGTARTEPGAAEPRPDPHKVAASTSAGPVGGNGPGSGVRRKAPAARPAASAPTRVRVPAPAPDPAVISARPFAASPLEDASPWQAFTDTAEPSSLAQDTLRGSGRSGRRSELIRGGSRWQDPSFRRNAFIVGGVAGAVVLFAALAAIVYFAFLRSEPDSGGLLPSGERRSEKSAAQGGVIYVSKSKAATGDLESISEAIRKASQGDRIVVRDSDVYEERLEIVFGTGKRGLSIEAEPDADGGTATIRAPVSLPAGEPLVSVDRVENFKLKGFNLDGARRCDEIIRISGNCPGSVYDDLRLKGFNRRAVQFESANGLPRREIVFRNTTIEPDRDKGAAAQLALFFNHTPRYPGAPNASILIQNCRIYGPYEQVVSIRTSLQHVTFERNVFFRGGRQGFAYPPEAPADIQLDVRLEGNTFVGLNTAFELQQQPNFLSSNIALTRNLFYQVPQGILLVRADMTEKIAAVIKGEDNYCDSAASKPGNLGDAGRQALGLHPLDFQLPVSNPRANEFLRYRKSSPLATATKDKKYVGALEPLP